MDGVKSFLTSTGVMGPLVGLICWGLKLVFKIDIGPADIQPIIDNGLLVAGAVVGIYGRIAATKKVGLTSQPPST